MKEMLQRHGFCHEITNKILPSDLIYIADVVI